MYEVFLLSANRTVSLQLVMNVLRWIVLSHCIYRISTATTDSRVLGKCFAVLEFFVSKRGGTLNLLWICVKGNP